ncbi:uncharacterized sulfatase [Pedobacter suwonensis]|uniref:Uncharacterized sulfatase n=1 Tax=Pedobacter suwonensis TaxID=332999 RepID=A0A1I0TNI4_9SPHI|nr:LTA synthase family protein [Pedobacter suwonensis]SFA53287.1 uncharacterized sulfatase [Pedobacter suwonensis]
MINRFKSASQVFLQIAIVWLIALIVIRAVEVLVNGLIHQFPANLCSFMLWSWLADISFWLKWIIFELILFIPLFFVNPRLATVSFKVFVAIIIFIQLALCTYFTTALVPLGADFYGYSFADIKQTVGASGTIKLPIMLSFAGMIIVLVIALNQLPKHIKVPLWLAWSLPILSVFYLMINGEEHLFKKNFENLFVNNLALNKVDYFFISSYIHFYPTDEDLDIYADSYIGDYGNDSTASNTFTYLGGSEYPFYRKANDTDVLTPFFNKAKNKPNLVVIIIEGLGRAFTNEGAYLGNFTPFIDSLSNKGLYWRNFLSAGGRTFAVLPSLMGSLPFGKNGFLELGQQMPDHLSLYSLLKFNGYKTSFYYGGDATFDNMNLFLQKNSVDEIRDLKSFSANYSKLPEENGFSWGYGDQELYQYYLANTSSKATKPPELNVILTVTTHNPFLINEQERYNLKFEQRMADLGFDETKKDSYRNYKHQYGTILYADDALRHFFNNYKKREDYNSTIFIITGDHRMPEIPMSNKIDRYHVPLIIYSPLLKRSAQFASISTHFDVTPSLLAYLHSGYGLNLPDAASWLGSGLDTARSFRNVHSYPLVQTKTEMIDFIQGQYHLNGTSLYQIGDNMQEELARDEVNYNRIKNAFENFKRKNASLDSKTRLLPPSVIQKYSPIKK